MSQTHYILMTAILALGASAQAWPAGAAVSGFNDGTFQIISERNIFDPNRGPIRLPPPPPPVVESLRLEGPMTYQGNAHAFFAGSVVPADGQVLGSMDSVAGCKIQFILNGSVTMTLPDGRLLVVKVGDEIQRVGDGPWQLSQSRPTPEARPIPRNNRTNRGLRSRLTQQESTN